MCSWGHPKASEDIMVGDETNALDAHRGLRRRRDDTCIHTVVVSPLASMTYGTWSTTTNNVGIG